MVTGESAPETAQGGEQVCETPTEAAQRTDIAYFINKTLDEADKSDVINLPSVDRNFKFPSRIISGKSRAFQASWVQEFPWLVYSKHEDGVYCKACVLFARPSESSTLKRLLTEPLTDWQVALKRLRAHRDKSEMHKASMTSLTEYKKVLDGVQNNVVVQLDDARKARVKANRQKLNSMLEIVILCGKQNFSLRGHRDDSQHYDDLTNSGNFQALVDYRVRGGDQVLAEHLASAPKNATYRSKTTQNDLISCCGEFILSELVNEITEAKLFSVLADEATDISNKSQLPIVIRYVKSTDSKAKEAFVGFIELEERPTGRAIATAVVDLVTSLGLDMANCRGQCYDGAGNMAGRVNGAAKLILNDYPKAEFTHCRSHALNLAVMKGCKVQTVKNMLNVVGDLTRFFDGHPVRANILKSHVEKECSKKGLIELCMTRWVERVDSLDNLFELYPYVVNALNEIGEGDFSGDTSSKANGLVTQLTTSNFVVAFALVRSLLHYSRGLTSKLQNRSLDWLSAYKEVGSVRETLISVRSNENRYSELFDLACELARKQSVEIKVPRVVPRQTLRENHNASNAKEYYKYTVYNPFIDHMVCDLNERFNDSSKMDRWQTVLPGHLDRSGILELAKVYEADLPTANSVGAEIDLFCNKLGEIPSEQCSTFSQVLSFIDSDLFPNLCCLLKILITKPVTTCECERSISGLRRLKTYLRSSMSKDRLNALALMSVHYTMELNRSSIIDLFVSKQPRRLEISLN